MKKMNRTEINTLARHIESKINRKKHVPSLARLIKEAKTTDEYKRLSHLQSNSAVRETLVLINHDNALSRKQDEIVSRYLRKHDYDQRYRVGSNEWIHCPKSITSQLVDEITIAQLMSDDINELVTKLINKYTNE